MATAVVGRASIDYDGDEWLIVDYLKEVGDQMVCRLRSKNRETYTDGDLGSISVETVATLDRDAVVKAALESAALRSGVLGVCILGNMYPLPGGKDESR